MSSFATTSTPSLATTTDCYLITSELSGESVGDIAWSGDGSVLAVASQNDILIFPSGDFTQDPIRLQGHQDEVVAIDINVDATYLASAGWDGTALVWNLENYKLEQVLRKRDGLDDINPYDVIPFLSVQFSPDGHYLAAGTLEEDRTAYVWEVGTWREIGIYDDHYTGVYGVAFNADSSMLATTSVVELRIYDIETSKILHRYTNTKLSMYSLTWDAEHLIFGAFTTSDAITEVAGIYRWNLTNDIEPQVIYPFSYNAWGSAIDFLPDRTDIIAFAGENNNVTLYDLATMRTVTKFGASESPIWSLEFNPREGSLAVSRGGNELRIWSPCS